MSKNEFQLLREMVTKMAVMSNSQLRELRRRLAGMNLASGAKDLLLTLIDLYLGQGDTAADRARVAAACLAAIDELEEEHGRTKASSGGTSGCLVVVAVAVILGAIFAAFSSGSSAASERSKAAVERQVCQDDGTKTQPEAFE